MLSRYSGLGSHRYPMGFSGDVHVTWNALQYQPYFTATAANVGYTWWSHDIGGHMNGIKDNELYIRWLQLGAFSPINRLHSNCNPFCGKEPWRYPKPYDGIAAGILRLRHQMLPYIYTMNYQCHQDMVPVVVPVYYHYPMEPDSYRYRNEYFFGTELLVQPMVHPTDRETGYTSEHTWVPEGCWTDFYDGAVYQGGAHGSCRVISRPIDRQGILAKAGAIVPMAARQTGDNSISNPETLEICVFPGGDNHYELFEDAGEGFAYEEGVCLRTAMDLSWAADRAVFVLKPEGDLSVIPRTRHYVLHFRGFRDVEKVTASEGFTRQYDRDTRTLTLTLEGERTDREIRVELQGGLTADNRDLTERVFAFLDQIQGSVVMKNDVMTCFRNGDSTEEIVSGLMGLELPESWRNVLMEMTVR